MKVEILLISIVFLTSSVQAQNRFLETNKRYNVAKIYLIDTSSLKVKNLTFINDTLVQYSVNSVGFQYYKEQCSTTNIKFIAVKNGNYAVVSGLSGGLAGLVGGSLFYLYQAGKLEDIAKIIDNPGWYFVGCIAGGAVAGTLIGLCIPKWEVLYLPDNKTSFLISPKANPDYCGLALTINF
jgi:hypothetical protein